VRLSCVFVVAEQRDGAPTSHSLELCWGASGLASEVVAFVWGDRAAEAGSALASHGASTVFDLGPFADRLIAPGAAAAIAGEVARRPRPPEAVLAPATYDGRDIAARLSARIDRPVLANATALRLEGEGVRGLVSEHLAFGGSDVVRARFTGPPPGIFLVRAKAFAAGAGAAPDGTAAAGGGRLAGTGELEAGAVAAATPAAPPAGDLGQADAARVVARHHEERGGPSLDQAKVVVAGGRGLGSADHYALVEELARLLGGAPAASRAIVDAGWVPYSYQVGQTGRTVSPEVYLAFGISGATQHLVGMKGAKHVVAVNNDESAPILAVADLGVVGDVHEVLPKLNEAIRAIKPGTAPPH
jgi:electron transfer flavoprotein alpha subunit